MSFLYWFRVSRFVRSQVSYLLSISDAQGCFNPGRATVSLFIDSRRRKNCLCITPVVGIKRSRPEIIGRMKENVSLLIEVVRSVLWSEVVLCQVEVRTVNSWSLVASPVFP